MGAAFALAPSTASAATLPLVTSWGGTPSTAPGSFNLLEDVSVGPSGDVFTVENGGGAADRVQRFSGSGVSVQLPFGSEGAGDGPWVQPTSLVVSPASEVFVTDAFDGRVSRFNAAGLPLQPEWGTSGSGPGQFSSPEGIAFGSGQVYVADRGNNQVDAYSPTGSPGVSWGGFGSATGLFNRIVEVSVGPDGDVYGVDRDNFRVQRFTPTGTFVRAYGGVPGTGPGQLRTPSDVAVDSAGDVWIADNSNSRISRFAADGTFKADYEQVGALFIRPVGLSFAPDGDLLIADTFPGSYRIIRAKTAAVAQLPPQPPPPARLPAPVLGKSVNVERVKGTVLIKLPAGSAHASQAKGTGFVPLAQARQIPTGSLLDTKRGTVRLTTATAKGAVTQSGDFGGGLFQTLQARSGRSKGVAELRLKGSSFSRCGRGRKAAASRLSKRRVRRLRGDAKGRFRTRGRYSAATVRGTIWTVSDRCDGTLTQVQRGKVSVRDFRRRKTITVRAGKRYLAKAPGG